MKNGDLLRFTQDEFDALLTSDRGIPHQQHLSRKAIAVVLLEAASNRFADIEKLLPCLLATLKTVRPSSLYRVSE
jgi:hypothetical protein